MNKVKYWKFLLIGSFLLVSFLFINSIDKEKADDDAYKTSFKEKYGIFALDLPEELDFAGELVPLQNFDTRESLDRELLVNAYWQSQTLIFIKLANRFFPIIEPILKENNIPDDFKYLVIAESGLVPIAKSPSGAVGFWQFLKGTATDYGLEVNSEVDERYHIEKATLAAAKYLKHNYEKYGSWTMVAASFNIGRTGLYRQVKRQKSNNYYDLLLPQETSRYVFRILAIKLILSNPTKYGFYVKEDQLYEPIPFYEVKIDSTINSFANFATHFKTNYKILKYLNPWLREPYLSNKSKKTYFIKIPEEGYRNNSLVIHTEEMDSLMLDKLE